ncbi:protocadherin gamma-B1-like [Cyrtonyx montezumae]|uniref:protocadherin gamma-B1-like n=1 Tax=Cyrtonyx montezumae TaxID=9017 RepID=UPI0032DBED34
MAVLLSLCCRAAPERLRYAISEELGRGSLVGPLARDLGLSPAELPARQLRLVSSDERYFSSDGRKHAELLLEKNLDREKQKSHNLILTAVDGGDPVRSGTAQINIDVTDANDNAPVFTKEIYKVRVPENLPEGSLAFQVKATDGDEGTNAEITYSFSDITSSARQLFSLDPKTGDVKITGPLDYENMKYYEVTVEGKDGGGLSAHTKVHIDVIDVNDNAPSLTLLPILNPVPEDSVLSTVVAVINVRDRDSGINGEVTCNLNGDLPFKLEASSESTYKLVIESSLDREEVSAYNITITATDQGSPALWSSADLTLKVSDVNDNTPVFEEAAYSAYVHENNAAGALVLRVSARDADAGANGRVSYALAGGGADAEFVSVQAETGALYAQRSFDYERCREFAVEVQARDGGTPALSATATVRVFVLDCNDNAPRVLWPAAGGGAGGGAGAGPFEVVPRSAEAGYLVAKVVAVDADSGRNAWLSYKLVQESEPELFRVEERSGEVRTARAVSERDAAKQRLVAVVKDHGRPALSATATLHVMFAESMRDALPELSESPAASDSPAELRFSLVLALALLSAAFLLSVALTALAHLRRAGPPAVLRCLGERRFSAAGPAVPADFCEGTLPYSYNLCVAPGRTVAEGAWLLPPALLPSVTAEEPRSGEPAGKWSPSGSAGRGEPPDDLCAPQMIVQNHF